MKKRIDSYNVGFLVCSGTLLICIPLVVCVFMHTANSQRSFMLLGHVMTWDTHTRMTLGFPILCALFGAILFTTLDQRAVSAYRVLALFISIVIVLIVTVQANKHLLINRGVGTIRAQQETVLWQDDLALKGELGVYAGQFTTKDGDEAIFICYQVDAYGPFSYPVLPAYESGEEYFVEADEATNLRSITMRQYDDGYWAILKSFRNAEDAKVRVEHLADLQKYAAQAEYHVYRDETDAYALHEKLKAAASELIP